MALYQGIIPIIKHSLDEGFLRGAEAVETGCLPRDFDVDPPLMSDSPDGMEVFDEARTLSYYQQQETDESSLEHLYLAPIKTTGKPAFEFLDQNGFPDCWAHSTCHAVMADRMKRGLPPLRFNGVGVATLLKQTNGGWCGLSGKFGRTDGLPVVGDGPGQWPYQSRKGHDTPELRSNMATHKAPEQWYDLGKKEWDQDLSKAQLKTLGSTNIPCPVDYNRFSHSIMMMRAVLVDGRLHPLILNSWKGWGYWGLGVLYDMWPDNAIGIIGSNPAIN